MSSKLRFSQPNAALMASAFVIAAFIIVQAGRLPGNPAHAEMATTRGDFTLMTTDSGQGGDADPWELLYILDSRAQVLLVYEVGDARQRQLYLRDGGSLDQLFRTARQ